MIAKKYEISSSLIQPINCADKNIKPLYIPAKANLDALNLKSKLIPRDLELSNIIDYI